MHKNIIMWSGCSLDKKVASETILEKQTNKQTNKKQTKKNKNKNENNVVKDCMGRFGTCSQYSAL